MIDRRARALITGIEMCRLAAYLDTGGVPTIGWGHTHGVKMGDACTQAQADQWFTEDTADAEKIVDRYITAPLSRGQRGALVSLAYNAGPRAFTGSDPDDGQLSRIAQAVNDQHHFEAMKRFLDWIFDEGKPLRGLARRRAKELLLYAEDPWPTGQKTEVA